MRHGITVRDGERISPGTWVEVTIDGRDCVGRFTGVFHNQKLGWIYELRYFSFNDNPKMLTCFIGALPDQTTPDSVLMSATEVEPPRIPNEIAQC